MGFADLFRPKWRHSKAEVRAQALRGLGADAQEILAQAARSDTDEAVRCIAIGKLNDPEVLAAIARDDASAPGQAAGRRAADLWVARATSARDGEEAAEALDRLQEPKRLAEVVHGAKKASVRTAALQRLGDVRTLVEIAREATEASVRVEAVAHISDVVALRGLAVRGAPRNAAFAAIDRLEDVETLEAIAKGAKSKNVRNRAKKRLAVVAPAPEVVEVVVPSNAAAQHAEQTKLVEAVELIVTQGAFARAGDVAAIRDTWDRIADVDAALATRLAGAIETFDAGLVAYQRAEAQRAVAAEKQRAAEAERQRVRDERRRRDDAAKAARAAERAAAPEPSAPTPVAAPEPAPPAKTAEDRQREAEANEVSLREVCAELEGATDQTKIRAVQDLLEHAAAVFDETTHLPSAATRDELHARYEAARTGLLAHLHELNEAEQWRQWASLTKQKTLVDQAQALLDHSEPDPELPTKLKALQDEWKAVRNVPPSKGQANWDRFRRTCDALYERVRAAQEVNLAHKIELCERAESLQDSTDWSGTATALKDLQAVWKTIGPVPRAEDQKAWERFRGACDAFFERRKHATEEFAQELSKNAERKEVLVAKVQALVESIVDDATWGRAKEETKAVQRTWRDLGPAPRKIADEQYKRFRAACDAVFSRLDDLERARVRAEAERIAAAREEAKATLAGEVTPEQLASLWPRLDGLGDESLVTACYEACATALTRDAEAFAGTELDPSQGLRRKLRLCERAEAIATPDAEAAPLAERLERALASNALGGVQDEARDPARQLAAARDAWRRIGPTPGPEGDALDARFAAACAAVDPG
jgi:hypothetical protein